MGKELIKEVSEMPSPPGKIIFWWLGQHSFIIKTGGKIIYIDPYITDKPTRLISPFFKAEEMTNADMILCTHDHSDHLDRPSLPSMAIASPMAIIVVPEFIRKKLPFETGIPAERFIGLNDGETKIVKGIKLNAIASAHEFLSMDEASGLYPFLGYVIESEGRNIYHPGDCCIYEGLYAKLLKWKIDLAFLPINGRDAVRYNAKCLGNMTFQEAADLAGTIKPALTVPTHYDMFANNRENPKNFTDYVSVKYPALKTIIPRYATPYEFPLMS
ncbi:MAG: MBL fold metallo-hydrolase [Candidatus Nanoarchaeia archaeon]